MPKQTDFQILTANDLLTGRVIYFDGQNWVSEFDQAHPFPRAEAASLVVDPDFNSPDVVGLYAANLTSDHRPDHFRESFRAHGPSASSITAA